MNHTLLTVERLRVTLATRPTPTEILHGISFNLGRERLGIVGESGSGKSMTARAILGLLSSGAVASADAVRLGDKDLLALDRRGWSAVRGRRIGMILQDPRHALNPVHRVGRQIEESLRLNLGLDRHAARLRSLALLEAVHIRDPERVYHQFPHEISGGMGQRIMIALMVAAKPHVLIADEPTSALDLGVQRQVLDVLDEQVVQRGMGLILISHDLDLVGRFCDRVLVMRAGSIVEELPAVELGRSRHPYTRGLLECVPDLSHPRIRLPTIDSTKNGIDEAA